jgi:transglutaminase-like putative cysteine protease
MNAFFTEVRRGHCELFASAMALAVRSLGIPARVVTGYLGGEWDPQNHSYLVREGMAHLWVEVLFPQYGWVPFDPSQCLTLIIL